jgi:hypothetical protein
MHTIHEISDALCEVAEALEAMRGEKDKPGPCLLSLAAVDTSDEGAVCVYSGKRSDLFLLIYNGMAGDAQLAKVILDAASLYQENLIEK